jgi:putative hydrolase of the HAD superfamily
VQAIVETRRWFWSDPGRHRVERTHMLRAWTRIASHALGSIGRADETLAAAIAGDFADRRWERMTLFPGVTAALETLRARSVPMALVTNGDTTHQRRKIAQHDLERFFDVIVIEGEMGVGKPEAVVYRYALSRLRVKPEDAWMVGDNLEWDVAAPQRLGLRGIWVDAPGQGLPEASDVAPHRIIRMFPELLDPEATRSGD